MHIKPSMIFLVGRCMLNYDARRKEFPRLPNDGVIHYTINNSDQPSDILRNDCALYPTYTQHELSQT